MVNIRLFYYLFMFRFYCHNLIIIQFIYLQPKHKKKFIDKKNAVTFHLVHRSQKDPLITDESAPQHVLVEGNKQPGKEVSQIISVML